MPRKATQKKRATKGKKPTKKKKTTQTKPVQRRSRVSAAYTVAGLRDICARNGVRGYSGKTKAWLINRCFSRREPEVERMQYSRDQLNRICEANHVSWEGQSDEWLMRHCFTRWD